MSQRIEKRKVAIAAAVKNIMSATQAARLVLALSMIAFSGCDTMANYKPPAEPDNRTLSAKMDDLKDDLKDQSKEVGEGLAAAVLGGLSQPWGFHKSL
jgi:hypothetical protein